MTREEAINIIKGWVLADKDREALEIILPEIKKDKNNNELMKEAIIDALEKYYISNTVFNGYSKREMISWLKKQIPPKWLYRLEYKDGTCGLWYNGEGKWCFEQGIGSLVGCKTKDLLMNHDERYKQDGRDWFSSCSNKEDLLHWYSLNDAEELIKKGFVFTRYLATEYHEYDNETVFIKESSLVREEIDIFELFGKTKPMFKEGDWLQYRSHEPFLVEEITKQGYVSGEECLPFEWENEIHLWTINDVRPGDIIVEGSRYITIYQSPTPNSETTFRSFCFVDLDSDVFVDEVGSHNIRGSYPATKKQRDLLFQKMKESGYEWDAEKKVLKKIHFIDEGKAEMNYCFTKMINGEKVSSSWGEEDEVMFRKAIITVDSVRMNTKFSEYYEGISKWLESLKERVQPMQEWSEDDEKYSSYICAALDCYYRLREDRKNTNGQEDLDNARNWLYNRLKSIRPKSQWKPSAFHLECIEDAIAIYEERGINAIGLKEILEELKKLK